MCVVLSLHFDLVKISGVLSSTLECAFFLLSKSGSVVPVSSFTPIFHAKTEALQDVTKYSKNGITAELTRAVVTAGLLFGLEQKRLGAKSSKPGWFFPKRFRPP